MFFSFQRSISVLGLVAIMGYAFFSLMKIGSEPQASESPLSIDYSMIRPADNRSQFDLSGRVIRRNIKGLVGQTRGPLPQSIEDAKKAVELKKGKVDPKAKKAQAQKKNSKKFVSNIVDTSRRSQGLSASDRVAEALYLNQKRQVISEPIANSENAPQEEKKEETKLTAEQWKVLLFATPTQSKANEFIKASRAREISQEAYLEITGSLIRDASVERQNVGVYILSNDYTESGFALAHALSIELAEPVKAKLKVVITGFGKPVKFSALSRVIMSTDPEIAGEGLRILQSALSQAGQQVAAQEETREVAAERVNPRLFAVFLPALRMILTRPDSSLLETAQALFEQITQLLRI
ncbi:MAG: hypothetical protein LW875_05515 [Proteobacteria bacterium]|nr:hypothetical protein [Pseudomonadota bacterium]